MPETKTPYDPRLVVPGRTVPLVGIDVDGVLNAVGHDLDPEVYRETRLLGYRIRLRLDLREVVAPLLELGATGRCDLYWATMWEAAAPDVLGPVVGFGTDWPWLAFTRPGERATVEERLAYQERMHAFAARGVYFKTPTIGDLAAAAGRPMIWVDDECGSADERYLAGRDDVRAPVRCVPCDARTGIGPAEVARIVTLVEDAPVPI